MNLTKFIHAKKLNNKSLQEQIATLETNVKKIESIEGYENNPELVANLTTLKTQIES